MKICPHCHVSQPLENFVKGRTRCRPCLRVQKRAWVEDNRQKVREYTRRYRKDYVPTTERAKKGFKRRRQIEAEKQRLKKQDPAYRKQLNEKAAARQRKKHAENPTARMTATLRSKVSHLISKGFKSMSTMRLLGCTIEHFKAHLESLWLPGMSWENYGTWRIGQPMTWHIDHIRPCASFDLTKAEDQQICFHYTNLQPLWAIDNRKKWDN